MSDFEEVVLLERINLIARLSSGCECQNNDKDIALIWIAELAKQVMGECSLRIDGSIFMNRS